MQYDSQIQIVDSMFSWIIIPKMQETYDRESNSIVVLSFTCSLMRCNKILIKSYCIINNDNYNKST